MAYRDNLIVLNPSHLFTMESTTLVDLIGSVTGTNSGLTTGGTALCEDSSASILTNGVTDILTLSSSSGIETEINRKAVGGWFMTSKIQQPPTRIYGEGNTSAGLTFHLGFGNSIIFEVDGSLFTLQIYSDVPLENNRKYHLLIKFESDIYGNEFSAYLDGVKQLDSENVIPNNSLDSRNVGEFGGKASGLAIGGTAMKIVSPVNGYYNFWGSWIGEAVQNLSDEIIRKEIFEKGALPENIITNQSELDAFANSTLDNHTCSIRVTGDGIINLIADNIKFNKLTSIDVQYTGTGTLNWTNINGSNASIGSTINSGTINFINPYSLTLTGIQYNTEIRVYEANTTNEIDGQENVTGGIFITTIPVTHIDIQIVSLDYKIKSFKNIPINQDTTIEIQQFIDRNYKND